MFCLKAPLPLMKVAATFGLLAWHNQLAAMCAT